MITDINLLIEKFGKLEALLTRYGELTARLSSTDAELVDETETIFTEREEMIQKMKLLNPQITEIIDKQTPEKAAAIRKMLLGETVVSDFADDEKAVQASIISLRSLQSDIINKDNSNQTRFKRKYDEVREELENMQKDKKKINFVQNVVGDDNKKPKLDIQT
ncbi:MAG: hypothetical protein FWG44_01335 [Oscillospiraceae bacterium]|nr:hypothetical protein [Oscillospiraceae bacterium]